MNPMVPASPAFGPMSPEQNNWQQQHLGWMAHPVLHAPQVITVEPQICGACCNYLASGGLCVVCPLLKTIRDLETRLKVPNAPVIYPQGGCSFSDSAMVKVMCSDLNGWGNPCDATLYVTIDGSAPRHQSSLSLSLSLSLAFSLFHPYKISI